MIRDKLTMFSPFPLIATIMALLLGILIGSLNPFIGAGIIGVLMVVIIIVLRQYQLAAVLVVVAHLYVDWYQGLRFAALSIVLVLLLIFFLTRSSERPWVGPRAFWLWILFLVVAIYPATRGVTWGDGATYYINIIFGPLILFWLGAVITRDVLSIWRFIQLLAGFAALLAVITIIQAATGTLLFGSSRFDQLLVQTANFQLTDTTAHRFGSFFVDPNWNGTFFATMLFLPVGLFFGSKSLISKSVYLIEIFFMALAMLYTFSNGAWAGAFAGLAVFVVFSGRMSYRVQFLISILTVALVIIFVFPNQVSLQIQHATAPYEVTIRLAAWQTGIRVIHAFPLTGVGLGLYAYLYRAEPYRGIDQRIPLAHPHNSYLELAAMAGLPVLAIFLVLLLLALWFASRNWMASGMRTRSLLGGGIAAITALSINSISINGWTLAPLAGIGWLILGAISSPLLAKSLNSSSEQSQSNQETKAA